MHKTFIRDDSQIEANHDYILLLFPLSKLRTLDQEPGVTEPNPNRWKAQGPPQGPWIDDGGEYRNRTGL